MAPRSKPRVKHRSSINSKGLKNKVETGRLLKKKNKKQKKPNKRQRREGTRTVGESNRRLVCLVEKNTELWPEAGGTAAAFLKRFPEIDSGQWTGFWSATCTLLLAAAEPPVRFRFHSAFENQCKKNKKWLQADVGWEFSAQTGWRSSSAYGSNLLTNVFFPTWNAKARSGRV